MLGARTAGQYGSILSVAISPDGEILAGGGVGDRAQPGKVKPEICLWDTRLPQLIKTLPATADVAAD
jgi:hypothetical protein